MLKAIAIAFALCLCWTCAKAQVVTGNTLVEFCSNLKPGLWCDGYLKGTAEWMTVEGLACFPSGTVTTPQLAAMLVQHLREHPVEWSQPAWQIAIAVISPAFPCH